MNSSHYDIFIDGGGNSFQSVAKYLSKFPADKVYVFEPNPVFHQSYDNAPVTLVRSAIWTEDTYKRFFLSRDERQVASSLLEEKMCKRDDGSIGPFWRPENIDVKCVDFAAWIREHTTPDQRIALKLDIEGAEVPVLWHLLYENLLSRFAVIHVEFHLEKIPEQQESYNRLRDRLQDSGIVLHDWD